MSTNASLPARDDCEELVTRTKPGPPSSGRGAGDQDGSGEGKLRRRFFGVLALSVVMGGAGGLILGADTGVKSALEAGARVDAATLAQALPWKIEIASEPSAKLDIARLLDEMRGLRAQIEQMRHNAEISRTAERLRALEAARETSAEAELALNRALAAQTARLDEIEARLSRVERFGADATPVGAVRKMGMADSPGASRARSGARAN